MSSVPVGDFRPCSSWWFAVGAVVWCGEATPVGRVCCRGVAGTSVMSGSDEEKQSERDVQQAIAIASASKEQGARSK